MTCLLSSARITIDAGHGGRDPGAVANGVNEKDMVLVYATALAGELRQRGHLVHETRTTDVFVELSERARLANTFGAELFVSLHCNASQNASAAGAWLIHAQGSVQGQRAARAVFGAMRAVPNVTPTAEAVYADGTGWTGGRGLTVLRRTAMPAILVELGFLTNAADAHRLSQPRMPRMVATAIASGVEEWLRSVQRP